MLIIDKLSGIPIYEQIINNLELLIMREVYPADTRLPSVRVLSQEICVNPNTLQKAFTELEREKICYSVSGSGRYVSKDAKDIIRREKLGRLDEIANLSASLKMFGVSREQIIECVNNAYNDGQTNKGVKKQ
jgi:GntR family transcriptional regulator